MIKATFKLTNEQELFLKEGNMVTIRNHVPKGQTPTPDRVFYFMPYWFEPKGDGVFDLYHLDNLPVELKDAIKNLKERNDGYL